MIASTLDTMRANFDDNAVKVARWVSRALELFDIHRDWALVFAVLDVEIHDRHREYGRTLAAVAFTLLATKERPDEPSKPAPLASQMSWRQAIPNDCLCHWRYQTKPDYWRHVKRNPMCRHHGGDRDAA